MPLEEIGIIAIAIGGFLVTVWHATRRPKESGWNGKYELVFENGRLEDRRGRWELSCHAMLIGMVVPYVPGYKLTKATIYMMDDFIEKRLDSPFHLTAGGDDSKKHVSCANVSRQEIGNGVIRVNITYTKNNDQCA